MLTTKRQIRKESDRYGFYGANDAPRIADFDGIAGLEPITDSDIDISDADITSTEAPLYTPPVAAAPVAPAAPVQEPAPEQPEIPARPKRKVQPQSQEDLLPTVKTRAFAAEKPVNVEDEAREKAPAKRERGALDLRTKVLLCVYIVVALVLAIAVITTGVSISRAAAQADAIAIEVAQKQTVVAEQERELAALTDSNAIRGKATQLGMVQAGAPDYTVSPVQSVDYPDAQPRTDGFDEFCDWLSKVLN